MGEAKRRGTLAVRTKEAIERNKRALVDSLGPRDTVGNAILRRGLKAIQAQFEPGEWQTRREAILTALQPIGQHGPDLATAASIRVRADEIGWYVFLCEQALDDPLCMDVSQASRALPFIHSLGARWQYADRVAGIQEKLRELVTKYKADPDGVIFEILVALSYAEMGYDVEMLPQVPPAKSPDLKVRCGNFELFVECKRLSRRSEYGEKERNEFLRVWDAASAFLAENGQWIWFDAKFHVEASSLPTGYLLDLFKAKLPLKGGEEVLVDSAEATIRARIINHRRVQEHLNRWRVKQPSAQLSVLLGTDWAPLNSEVTLLSASKCSEINGCEAGVLGTFIESMGWACGMTRVFDAEESIERKARDVKTRLSQAVEQLPTGAASVVHIGVETLEGHDIERRRTEKVMASMPEFVTDKPLAAVRVHLIQANQTIDKLWELDETVQKFQPDSLPISLDGLIPSLVVIPGHLPMRDGAHWDAQNN